MKVTILGSGAALLDPQRGHSAIAVQVREKTYLLDCGTGATRTMVGEYIDPLSVEAVFLTHLHFDHIADLPVFVIGSWMSDRQTAPVVYGPEGTEDFVDHLFEGGAFDVDIRARVQYAQRQTNLVAIRPDVRRIKPGVIFEDDRMKVTAALVKHMPEDICECYGLRLESEGKVVTFSGDTMATPTMQVLGKDADLLIHEATFPEEALEFRAKSGIGTYSHTSPRELGQIARDAGVKALVATHIGHWDTTNPILRNLAAKHMPTEIIGPQLLDVVVADIRRSFDGTLLIAKDGLSIEV